MTKKTKIITAADREKCLDTFMPIKWRVSRAADTYGYSLLSLSTPLGFYRAIGGGYSMNGAVLGEFLTDFLTDDEKAAALAADCYGIVRDSQGFYCIGGSCGVLSMEKIAAAAGYNLQTIYSPRGKNPVIGYQISKL